ncbi:MAG: flagellar hook-basal body complex protein, partial [Bacteroidota bacterium]|nr:flagellar hook-basal body complex protein [Bacteroidota bacterium]
KAGTNPTDTSGGTNTFQIGLGSKINSIDRNWSQGTFDRTGVVTDLALQGNGMFVLKSQGVNYYSRAGAFTFDANGNLVDPQNGAIVQGKMANNGVLPSGNSLTDIKVDNNLRLPAIQTSETNWTGNLNSNANLTRSENVIQSGDVGSSFPKSFTTTVYDESGTAFNLITNYTSATAFTVDVQDSKGVSQYSGALPSYTLGYDANNKVNSVTGTGATGTDIAVKPDNSSVHFNLHMGSVTNSGSTSATIVSSADNNRQPNVVSGSVTIFDSLGNSHTLTLKFTKLADNTWNWDASIPSADGTLAPIANHTLSFNSDGSLVAQNPPVLNFTPTGGAKPQSFTLDFGSGVTGITQTSGNSSISLLSQDGAAAATLSNLNIDQYGNVVGVFSNGKTQTLAQVMVATFKNREGLVSIGDNMYNISANSGDPFIGALGSETGTTLQSGALEQSNVDLSEEFTKMIVSQRGFQANARVVTTADNLLQEITNLVR